MMFYPGFALFGLAGLALTVWAIVDVVSRPDWAFQAAGSSKVLWIVLELVGLLICGGLVFSLIYLLAIRPRVNRAVAFGGPGPAGSAWAPPPPPGWGPPPSGWSQPPPSGWAPPPSGWAPAPPPPPPGSGWAPAPPAPPSPTGTASDPAAPDWTRPATPPPPQAPAGWYPDPAGSGGSRYWDGARWSD